MTKRFLISSSIVAIVFAISIPVASAQYYGGDEGGYRHQRDDDGGYRRHRDDDEGGYRRHRDDDEGGYRRHRDDDDYDRPRWHRDDDSDYGGYPSTRGPVIIVHPPQYPNPSSEYRPHRPIETHTSQSQWPSQGQAPDTTRPKWEQKDDTTQQKWDHGTGYGGAPH